MTENPAPLFEDLRRYIEERGVRVLLKEMDIETPGEFDGLTITINPRHDPTAACYYLAHSFGSIVQWSTDFSGAQRVFEELRDAKRDRREVEGFEKALTAWREFESRSSDYAVGIFQEIRHAGAVQPYTVFFRADLEAMTIFHRTGKAPRWPDFFAEWKSRVERGEIRIEPFTPRTVPLFQPVRIEQQEVLQERD